MPNARPLLSAAGVLTGALLFAASPASAQWPVFDGINYALQGVIKTIEETMSNTLSNITKQLEVDRAARDDPRQRRERQRHDAAAARLHPERQLRQGLRGRV